MFDRYERLSHDENFGPFIEKLQSERGFLMAKLLTNWADGEDEKGFYEISSDGTKSRRTVSEDGQCVYDNHAIYLKRIRSRIFFS